MKVVINMSAYSDYMALNSSFITLQTSVENLQTTINNFTTPSTTQYLDVNGKTYKKFKIKSDNQHLVDDIMSQTTLYNDFYNIKDAAEGFCLFINPEGQIFEPEAEEEDSDEEPDDEIIET